jgi:hypothetical protein
VAFNLIAEADSPINWERLLSDISPIPGGVECFPIPSGPDGVPDALGVSLLAADEPTWAGFVALAEQLWAGGLRLFELYSGTEVTPGSLAYVRQQFTG